MALARPKAQLWQPPEEREAAGLGWLTGARSLSRRPVSKRKLGPRLSARQGETRRMAVACDPRHRGSPGYTWVSDQVVTVP